jgi:amino acid permease
MSSDPFEDLFSREDVLAGLPTKRANALLFLIESRTAHLVAGSRQAMDRFLTEAGAQERELAFLEAYALGRDPPLRPTIQDIERHSSAWAPLVVDNARVRAALAHRLGEKYRFTQEAVPGIRAVLGLDDVDVARAHERLYGEPLERIYAPRVRFADRIRRAWTRLSNRLERLPPFWTAYSLTLTETVGATILALPIALAAVGPLPGLLILAVLGVVNILTVSFMAEAISRSGTIRYGTAFIGRIVGDFLGHGGSVVLTVALFLMCLLVLPVYYIGVAVTLEEATRVPAPVWVALLFVLGLYYLRRQSLTATIASALIVGAVNIGLVIALSLLALSHARLDNLRYMNLPVLGGRPFDSGIVGLVFGVVLAAYFGHISVAICGRVVLHRDPSARSLVRGCAAAQGTAVLIYCLFVLAVNGAVAPPALANEAGTALSPLARQVGSVVLILGSAFVILGMGMGSVTFALALFGLVRERLPLARPVHVVLPRRRARLLFEPRTRSQRRDGLRVALVYLGLDGGDPRFRVEGERAGSRHRVEATVRKHWDVLEGLTQLSEDLPHGQDDRTKLAVDVSDADEQRVRLRVTSSLRLAYVGEWDIAGLHLGDILALPDAEAELVGWIIRRGDVSLDDVAEHAGRNTDATRALLAPLVDRGIVAETTVAGQPRYAVRAATRRGGRLPKEIWQAFAEQETHSASVTGQVPATSTSFGRARLRPVALGKTARFTIGAAPVLAAFLAAEWMVLTDSGSFTGLLNFVGTIVVSLLAGIFPVLLLRSSRRKGEYPAAAVYSILSHPTLLAAIYLLFLVSVLAHGMVIWDGPVERAGALLAAAVTIGMTVVMARRGAFAARTNVEVRANESDQHTHFMVTAAGRPAAATVRLEGAGRKERRHAADGEIPAFGSLQRLTFESGSSEFPTTRELKIWAHRTTTEHGSEGLPARVQVRAGEQVHDFDMELSQGKVVLPLTRPSWRVDITPAQES